MAYTTIDDPTIYFTTNLRSGLYGGSDTAFDIGFQPDWIWNKKRSGTGVHSLFDSVRGFGSSGKVLYSNTNGAEATNALIKSVSSTGFTVTASSDDTGTMVDWCWKAGGSASSNTDGSITSTVSANQTAGFSIVSFTGNGTSGATVGHGLSSAPKVIILKDRDTGINSWVVGHNSLGWTKYLYLNKTDASGTTSGFWNDTAPTSSVFTLGNNDTVNGSGGLNIAYCFADTGNKFFKAGSYTGNGNTDGTFIYCGFQPAWVMIKRTDGTNSWVIYDNKREGYNVDNDALQANGNNAEGTSDDLDILSNGFKMRTSGVGENGSGNSYIFMCFAKNPFTTSTGIPTTAR